MKKFIEEKDKEDWEKITSGENLLFMTSLFFSNLCPLCPVLTYGGITFLENTKLNAVTKSIRDKSSASSDKKQTTLDDAPTDSTTTAADGGAATTAAPPVDAAPSKEAGSTELPKEEESASTTTPQPPNEIDAATAPAPDESSSSSGPEETTTPLAAATAPATDESSSSSGPEETTTPLAAATAPATDESSSGPEDGRGGKAVEPVTNATTLLSSNALMNDINPAKIFGVEEAFFTLEPSDTKYQKKLADGNPQDMPMAPPIFG